MLESKIFANGSTTLPKFVREALGVKAGDRLRYVISEKGVHVVRLPSDDNSMKTHEDASDLQKALDASEKVMDENRTLLRKLK